MEEQKDNFWLWIGLVIAGAIVGVFLLKARENEVSGWENGAYTETKAQVEKQISKAK